MRNFIFLNQNKDGNAPTVLAGYFKFGSHTLILGTYGSTGGGNIDRV